MRVYTHTNTQGRCVREMDTENQRHVSHNSPGVYSSFSRTTVVQGKNTREAQADPSVWMLSGCSRVFLFPALQWSGITVLGNIIFRGVTFVLAAIV